MGARTLNESESKRLSFQVERDVMLDAVPPRRETFRPTLKRHAGFRPERHFLRTYPALRDESSH
jgi:hypothetical protein